jgi:putative ABC transport system permease protein
MRAATESLLTDLRYAVRQLRGHPGFALICILTLALGIGASTAIFSVVNPILFESLPYPHANRIMTIWDRGAGGSRLECTFGTYNELRARSRFFDHLTAMAAWQPTISGSAGPERLDGQRVSASYFQVLGIAPALGRDFETSEDKLRGPRVVILSEGLWRRRLGGDPRAIGRQITLDGNNYTIIGVMPRGFENVLAASAEIWSPLQYDMSLGTAWGHHLRVAGRLHPGVGRDRASREIDAIANTPVKEFPRPPWAAIKLGLIVNSLQDDLTSEVKPAMLAVLGAVMILLAIACVNVTNLLLARGARRRGEMAMRAVLGSGRGRIIRQLLTESLLLSAIGGALGIEVAAFGVRVLTAMIPPEIPRVAAIGLNGVVLGFALGVMALTGLISGLIPALDAGRIDLHAGLETNSRRTAGGRHWTRRTLVTAEVAMALVLLVGSGLLLRSLQRLFSTPLGFNASQRITMQVQTAEHRFFMEAVEAVRRVPGVMAAGLTSQLPLSGDQFGQYGVYFESSAINKSGQGRDPAFRYSVTPGYVEAMGIALLRGRLLDTRDTAGSPLAVLLSESFAKRKFPGQDPVGKRIHVGPDEWPWATIVGVVADVKQTSLSTGDTDAFYMTDAQSWFTDRTLSLVVHVRGGSLAGSGASIPAIKQAIWNVDKDAPITRVSSMKVLVAASEAKRRFVLMLFEAFGIAALALAGAGIYGVLSGSVSERVREIGVRSALGASRGSIAGLILWQGMALTGLGVVIGLAGAVAASKAIAALLFGVTRLDPVTYLGVIALLAGVSAVACLIPAWRAAGVDPAVTLRAE